MKKVVLFFLMSVLAACAASPYHYVEPAPSLRLTLLPYEPLVVGKPIEVDVKLNDIKNLYLIKDNDLEIRHTRKIHLLIVDSTLTDYQHVHPEVTGTPGVYHFQFTPKMPGSYRVFADVTQVITQKQEFVNSDLGVHKPAPIDKAESHEATVGGYHFNLTFDTPPVEGGESMGTIIATDSKGNKVTSLQPLMGAFSHIVGFYEDYHTIVHTHPMGEEPKNDTDRGGPELTFHLIPVKSGFIKLFAQVKIGNKELYVPFGVNIAKADDSK